MDKNTAIFGLFWVVTTVLLVFFLLYPPIYFGGDLVEYYGITESVLNHASIVLRPADQASLEKVVNPINFQDPQYYIKGRDGNRYPVHFILYSFLITPIRLLLRIANLPEINALRIGNLMIFSGVVVFVLQKWTHAPFKKLVFLISVYLSPLLSFIIWPGTDLFFLSLELLAIYYFFEKRYLLASFVIVLASWHSQPLIMLGIGAIGYVVHERVKTHPFQSIHLLVRDKTIIKSAILCLFLLLPYVYNYLIFGVFTPWTIFQDGWTKHFGFGLHNASLWKLFEQFFDLNMGLFWYAPVLTICGLLFFVKVARQSRKTLVVLLLVIFTAFFYQTNPAWHYGTSGYGPTRHVLYIIPFLLYFFVQAARLSRRYIIVLFLYILSQAYVLSFNGFLVPDFIKVLYHSPYATYILNNYPSLYNPTPEIFVDRTNHADLKYITSAIYKDHDVCKKAYVLSKDQESLIQECGFIPKGEDNKHPDMFGGFYVNY